MDRRHRGVGVVAQNGEKHPLKRIKFLLGGGAQTLGKKIAYLGGAGARGREAAWGRAWACAGVRGRGGGMWACGGVCQAQLLQGGQVVPWRLVNALAYHYSSTRWHRAPNATTQAATRLPAEKSWPLVEQLGE